MNSTTKIIAGVAVLALLFAGIGFAVNYTAETSNEGNQIGVAYMTVNEGETGAAAKLIGVNSSIVFDTVTTGGTPALTFNSIDIKEGKIYVKNGGSATVTDVTLTVECKNCNKFVNTTFAINSDEVTFAASTISTSIWEGTIDSIAAGETVTVNVQFVLADGVTAISEEDANAIKNVEGGLTFDIIASASTPTA